MRLLKEPLLHFLFIGGLLFAAYAAIAPDEEAAPTEPVIRIAAADPEWLKEMWTRQWHRPPADGEPPAWSQSAEGGGARPRGSGTGS